jgi:hypothetical protein
LQSNQFLYAGRNVSIPQPIILAFDNSRYEKGAMLNAAPQCLSGCFNMVQLKQKREKPLEFNM